MASDLDTPDKPIDWTKLPPVLPSAVPRVNPDTGLPSKATLDQETFLNSFYRQAIKGMDRRVIDLKSQTGDAVATIHQEMSVITGEQFAQAQILTELDARVGDTEASIDQEVTARVQGDEALALIANNLRTDVNGHTATINTHTSSINGMAVKWGVEGNIDGSRGGFVFSGVKQIGAASATWNLIIDANVTINGNLTVDGTINNQKMNRGAISGAAVAVANLGPGGNLGVTLFCRDQSKVLINVSMSSPGTGGYQIVSNSINMRNYTIFVDGSPVNSFTQPDFVYAGFQGNPSAQFFGIPSSCAGTHFAVGLPAGFHNFSVSNGSAPLMLATITALELGA